MHILYNFAQMIVLVGALIGFGSTSAIPIEPGSSATHTLTWDLPALAGATEVKLTGYQATVNWTFALPTGWQIQESDLLLTYQMSSALQARAAMTVTLNAQVVLTSTLKSESGVLAVALPPKFLRAGNNQLTLTALLPLPGDSACVHPPDQVRWLRLGAGSQIQVMLTSAKGFLPLTTFPEIFALRGLTDQLTFVLPDQPTDAELSALAQVAFTLAQATSIPRRWQLLTNQQLEQQLRNGPIPGPVVLIGTDGYNQQHLALAPPADADNGWLSLTRPPWSAEYPVLAVGGADDRLVLQAATALNHPAAKPLFASQTAIVPSLPPYTVSLPAETFQLADLGYGEKVIRATGTQTVTYRFDRPLAWSAEDGQLALSFAHTPLLDPATSYLTITLNAQMVARIQLDAQTSNQQQVTMPLAATLLRPGHNLLHFTFDLQPKAETGTTCASDTGLWGKIGAETRLTLPHGERGGGLDLQDFPNQIATPTDLAALAIVLPTASATADYADALALLRTLSLPQSPFAPQLLHAETINAATRQGQHLLLLGPPSRQPLLAALNPFLPVAFAPGADALRTSYGLRLPANPADLGVIQELQSPWNPQRLIISIAGSSWRGYQYALHFLNQLPAAHELASGRVALVTMDEANQPQVAIQPVADLGALPIVGRLDRLIRQTLHDVGLWTVMVLPLLALSLLALSVTTFTRWHSARQSWAHENQGGTPDGSAHQGPSPAKPPAREREPTP